MTNLKTKVRRLGGRVVSAPSPQGRKASCRVQAMMAWALALGLLTGCSTTVRGPHQEYTSPAVSGRVVDETSGQAIENVRVTRLTSRAPTEAPLDKTGGMMLIEDSPAYTGADGTFYIPAKRAAYLFFGSSSSLTLTLRAERSGFLTMVTNYDLVKFKSVKTDRGPEVRAGDLHLSPK